MSRVKGSPKTGGKKKGSKHKKTIEQELALEFLRTKVRKEWENLIDTKIELATGIWAEKVVMKDNKKVLVKVYRKQPDGPSLEYLFSIVVGKPTQPVDVSASKDLKNLEVLYRKMFERPKKKLKNGKI